jgi:hypothetical protein
MVKMDHYKARRQRCNRLNRGWPSEAVLGIDGRVNLDRSVHRRRGQLDHAGACAQVGHGDDDRLVDVAHANELRRDHVAVQISALLEQHKPRVMRGAQTPERKLGVARGILADPLEQAAQRRQLAGADRRDDRDGQLAGEPPLGRPWSPQHSSDAGRPRRRRPD